ncbi:hypothetical protein D3C72_2495810 [compost metagenome]
MRWTLSMAPPSKPGETEKTISIRWLAGSDGSVLRLKVMSALRPRPGTVIWPCTVGEGLPSPSLSCCSDQETLP